MAVVNVQDYGALGNGSADDTSAATSAITAAGVNGTVHFPAGTYIVVALVPLAGQTWYGAGLSSTLKLKSASATKNVIQTTTGAISGVVIRDLAVDGNAANVTGACSGISLLAAQSCSVLRVTVADCTAFGVRLRAGASACTLTDVSVANCADAGISVENSDDVTLSSCEVTTSGNGALSYGAGIYIPSSSDVTLSECSSTSNDGHGVYADASVRLSIDGGTFSGNGVVNTGSGSGVRLGTNCDDCSITGAVIDANAENGIYSSNAGGDGLTVSNCVIRGNNTAGNPGGNGIEVNYTNARVSYNVSTGNNNGVSCNTDGALIESNLCSNSTANGIKVYNASSVKVVGNTCTGNAGQGVDANADAVGETGLLVSANTITGNAGYGIAISSDYSWCEVVGNTLLDNSSGSVANSSTNQIVANSLSARRLPRVVSQRQARQRRRRGTR